MELTLDDCLALAARECATEHELRAALCVAVGQALHYRYEARGYSDAAETAKRDADRARAEARAYSEALVAQDNSPARAEVWELREAVDALRARAERAEAERDAAVQEREAFSLRLSAAERERDEARAERDAALDRVQALHTEVVAIRADFGHQRDITEYAIRERDEARAERDALRDRPTYEARATAPTRQELRLHREQHGGWWIVTRAGDRPTVLRLGADDADDAGASPATPRTWVPLGADGLPCAWPVVP